MAAAEAARKRRHMRWMTSADMSVLEEAEEDYDEPEESITSDGIPIEPFHLRRERAEGFFDEEGNYVENRVDPEVDAWLDSLGGGLTELEPGLAARLAAEADAAAAEPTSLDEDDVAIYKKRIVDMLQPGENVLQALRRLGGHAARRGSPQPAAAAARRQRQRQKRKHEELQQQQQNPEQPALTGAGQAGNQSQAVGQGQQLQGQQPQEPVGINQQQQRQQQPQGVQQLSGVNGATSAATVAQGKMSEAPGSNSSKNDGVASPPVRSPRSPQALTAVANSNKAGGSTGGNDSLRLPRVSQHGNADGPAAAAAAARIPPQNQLQFDMLTEYADMLLTNGDVNIYTATREELLGQLDLADLAVMLGETLSPGKSHNSSGGVGVSVPSGAWNESRGRGRGIGNNIMPTQQQQHDGSESSSRKPDQAETTKAAAAAGDGGEQNDVDMFAEDDAAATAIATAAQAVPVEAAKASGPGTARPAAIAAAASESASHGEAAVSNIIASAAATAVAATPTSTPELGPSPAAAAARLSEPDTDMADVTAATAAGPAHDHQYGSSAAATDVMDGFVFDESSGYYYNSSLGYYFDSGSGLFGDAASGVWYSYQEDTGTYTPAMLGHGQRPLAQAVAAAVPTSARGGSL
eukprot:GHRR01007762.1.p1 GENE.GHRR01007762.1~~GHRR01007762.1.p1  ORF type:complete len:636 (+),score=316.63 GHRR01007762.1:577-2484(+)